MASHKDTKNTKQQRNTPYFVAFVSFVALCETNLIL